MGSNLVRLKICNYRCLADLSLELRPINVFFGGNGSGKSTILDAIWFFHECGADGVEAATANRGHGPGLFWDGAREGEPLTVSLTAEALEYTLTFGLAGGRIKPAPGETLTSLEADNRLLLHRAFGSNVASISNPGDMGQARISLREPDRLSIGRYLDFNPGDKQAAELERLLLADTRLYHTRSFDFWKLRLKGSEVGHETHLDRWGGNAWSVLRNLHDRRDVDGRFDMIMRHMAEAFPTFKGLLLEQTGPTTVYAQLRRQGGGKPHYASEASDGHIQMLLLLTALFSEGQGKPAVLLFDEPELSLHPHALAAFAGAVREAAARWGKQVLIATHSPALLSQFDPVETLATSLVDGRTEVTRLSDVDDLRGLLEEYPTGSLYMTEVVGAQSGPATAPDGD